MKRNHFRFELPFVEPLSVVQNLTTSDGLIWFDSSDCDGVRGRYSYLGLKPKDRVWGKVGHGFQSLSGHQHLDGFELLRLLYDGSLVSNNETGFIGGWAGWIGYEMAHLLEEFPLAEKAPEHPSPNLAMGFYDEVLGFDLKEHRTWLSLLKLDRAEADETYRSFQTFWAGLKHTEGASPIIETPTWKSSLDQRQFEAGVGETIRHILDGELFQANLTTRYQGAWPKGLPPLDFYLQFRQTLPAPYGGFCQFGDDVLFCGSPERFFSMTPTGQITTSPMKGSRRKSPSAEINQTLMAELAENPKDRAENIMIVDLMRNDLSKVALAHSIHVAQLCAIEEHSAMIQMVSSIQAQIEPNKNALDLLVALFPGGSVTGAPKIRAMAEISAQEKVARGPYCGAFGWLGTQGAADFNIIIRSLVKAGDHVLAQAGAGITRLSDPAQEWLETMAKLEKLIEWPVRG